MQTNRTAIRFLRPAFLAAAFLGLTAFAVRPEAAADISVFGRPMIVVSNAELLPIEGQADLFPREFDLRLTLDNIGSATASHLFMTMPANDYMSVRNASPSFGLNWINAGSSKQITIPMILDGADPSGKVQPVFHFEYYQFVDDDKRFDYANDETVALDFGPLGWNRPALAVESFSVTPEHPAAGESFDLAVPIRNFSAGEARQVLVRLGDDQGTAPFATQNTANVGFVGIVPPSGAAETKFPLLVNGSAAPGVYPLPVTIAYENLFGEGQTESEVIYLRVRTRPSLQADLITAPAQPLLPGQSFDLPFEIINLGTQTINAGNIELVSPNLTVENGSMYAGPLDGGTSASLPVTVTAEKSGTARATLTVHYLDEYNQPQTWSQEFTFQIQDAAAPAEASVPEAASDGGGPLAGIGKALLAFLGFGG